MEESRDHFEEKDRATDLDGAVCGTRPIEVKIYLTRPVDGAFDGAEHKVEAGQVDGARSIEGAVGGAKRVKGEVGGGRPVERAVGGARPVEEAVGGTRPVEGAVDWARPVEGAVGRVKPVEGAVGGARPVEGAVDGGHIQGAVGGARPVEGAVGGARPIQGAVGGARPVEGAVGGARPVEGAVGGAKPVGGAVGGARPVEGAVGGARPVEGAVGGARPVEGAVGGARPVEGAVGAVGGARPVEETVGGARPVKALVRGQSVTEDMVVAANAALAHIERGMWKRALRMSRRRSKAREEKDEGERSVARARPVEGAVGGARPVEEAVGGAKPVEGAVGEPVEGAVGGARSVKALVRAQPVTKDMVTDADAVLDDIERGQERNLPLTLLSGLELHQHRVDVLFHLLDKLKLKEYQDFFRVPLKSYAPASIEQPDPREDVITRAKASSPAEIDAVRKKIVSKIKSTKLSEDAYELVEMALMALIRDGDSAGTTFDLINVYNTESISIPESFFWDCRDLTKLTKRSWRNYVLDKAKTISSGCLEDGNDIKRTLARVCKALSKKLRKPTGDLSDFISLAPDVFDMGKELASNKRCIHAVFAFYTAAKLYKRKERGYSSQWDYAECAEEINYALERMEGMGVKYDLIVEHLVPLVERLLAQI